MVKHEEGDKEHTQPHCLKTKAEVNLLHWFFRLETNSK